MSDRWPHIFVVGFNRCGTQTIHNRLEELGYVPRHWGKGATARRLKANHDRGAPILSGFEGYDALTDMNLISATEVIEGNAYFREFLAAVPDGKFILNTRDKANWIASRRDLAGGTYLQQFMVFHGYTDEADAVAHWSRQWDAQHAAVRATIPPQQLLVFDIEREDITKLDVFLGHEGPAPRRRHVGAMPAKPYFVVRRVLPEPLRRRSPAWLRDTARQLFRKRRFARLRDRVRLPSR